MLVSNSRSKESNVIDDISVAVFEGTFIVNAAKGLVKLDLFDFY